MVRSRKLVSLLFVSWKQCPLLITIYTLLCFSLSIITIAQVLIIAKFIDLILLSKEQIGNLHLWIAVIIGIMILPQMLENLIKILEIKIVNKLLLYTEQQNTKKIVRLEYKYIEDNEVWDLIKRVTHKSEHQIFEGFKNIIKLVSLIIEVIIILYIIFMNVWWVSLAIVVCMIPTVVISIKTGKATYSVKRELTETERECDYLYDTLTHQSCREERTLFAYDEQYRGAWKKKYTNMKKALFYINTKWELRVRSGAFAMVVSSVFSGVVLLRAVLQGFLSVGLFITVMSELFKLINIISYDVHRILVSIVKVREYAGDCYDLHNLSEISLGKIEEPQVPFESLEIRHLSFKYPGTEKMIFSDLNLFIERGSHYAIVGENGAGKSTLIKLLIGLYDNYDGQILLNGKDILSYSQLERFSTFSVVFQDFCQYNINLYDNLTLDNSATQDEIIDTLKDLNMYDAISQFEKGLHTSIGKIYDEGIELSTGQWQKIVLARTLLSQKSVTILDEPTSAMDPIQESKLYEHYGKINNHRTTIFISHRLGSVKLADYIYAIKDGAVLEEGTHDELIKLGGSYFLMYQEQKGWYHEE